jgi:hypothetical protein
MLKELEEKGLIVESASRTTSGCLFAAKKGTTEKRLCIDYRKLNAACTKEATAIPKAESLFDAISKAKYYCKLDLRNGFWQVRLDESIAPLTAFACDLGVYEWRVLPFGLHGAPKTFQRLLQHVLKENLWNGVVVFIDDITVYHSTLKGLEDLMAWTLERLSKAELYLNVPKCAIAVQTIDFLGHKISDGKITSETEKCEAIKLFLGLERQKK